MIIEFIALTHQHCVILHQWLQLNHVREFWDDGDRELKQVMNHYLKVDQTRRYLFYIDNVAVGYIQIYPINNTHQYAKLTNLVQECSGIDFFIGNPSYLRKGLSCPILTEFIASYGQSKPVIVDPIINNHKAINIYEKIGFNIVSEFMDKGNRYLLMVNNNQYLTL